MSAQAISGLVLAQAGDTASSLMGMAPILLMFVVLYFLMIRPQMKRQKEHKALLAALAKGDEVISAGALIVPFGRTADTDAFCIMTSIGFSASSETSMVT